MINSYTLKHLYFDCKYLYVRSLEIEKIILYHNLLSNLFEIPYHLKNQQDNLSHLYFLNYYSYSSSFHYYSNQSFNYTVWEINQKHSYYWSSNYYLHHTMKSLNFWLFDFKDIHSSMGCIYSVIVKYFAIR